MSFANQFKLLCALPLFSGLLLSVMFLVGYFNGFTDPAFTGLFYVHVVALAFAVAISFLSFIQLSLQSRWHVPIALFSLFFFVAVSVALGALPAVSRDALIHHLAVPKLWLQSGAVTEISWHEWSYYPMLLQIGFVGFLQNGLVGCTPLYHASYLWICAGILSLFVFERHKDSRLAIVAHLVLLSLPICFRLSTESLVDLGLVLYCGIATVLALEWADGKRPLAGCIGVGLALGFACATKYNGMLFAALFLLCLLQLGVRAKRGALSSLMF
ncbi:MAG: hypothetical protein KDD64_14480, partial [Bdellovibrionales bacterium]|nr:hypothetical protein [Bdellovibrionales bacterium]